MSQLILTISSDNSLEGSSDNIASAGLFDEMRGGEVRGGEAAPSPGKE